MFIGYDVSVSLPLRKIDNTTSNYHEVDWDFDANLVSLCIYGLFVRMSFVFLCNINHCNDSAPCWDLDWTIKSNLILFKKVIICYCWRFVFS